MSNGSAQSFTRSPCVIELSSSITVTSAHSHNNEWAKMPPVERLFVTGPVGQIDSCVVTVCPQVHSWDCFSEKNDISRETKKKQTNEEHCTRKTDPTKTLEAESPERLLEG